MREADIKALLLNRLRAYGILSSRAVLANEYPVGRTSVRADLAFLANDFVGVEIKSEHDSLRRLPLQLSTYRQFFDRTVLVLADRHVTRGEALNLEGVDLWRLSGGNLELLACHPKVCDAKPLADLLTAAQREKWVDRHDPDQGRDLFTAAFRLRFGETSRQFWRATARRKIKSADLSRLSRFHHVRVDQVRLRTEREASWSQWGPTADVG